jgi:hypothetical protein
MIIKILAAVFTGIGGHFLNRRWDKAILFFCLFLFYWAAVYAFLFFSFQDTSVHPEKMLQKIEETTKILSTVFSSGIFILWIISIIVTISDSRMSNHSNIVKWTKSGIAGASLTSFLSFLFLAFTASSFVSTTKSQIIHTEDSSETDFPSHSLNNFYEYLYFGSNPPDSYKLPLPPAGNGALRGRILYQSKTAEAVSLDIVLNGKYRAKNITTDSDGIFTVNLPFGDWTINSIQTESWQNKPEDGDFTLYYGGEEKFRGKNYSRHANSLREGFTINIDENEETVHLNIIISPDIKLLWPDQNKDRIHATITDTLSWEKYPSASTYYVEIKKIRREGRTTYFDQITSRILSNKTTLPLSSLKHVKTNKKEKNEYAADIFAFSEDGTLIAEFSESYRGGSFLLSDGNVLIEDSLNVLLESSYNEDPKGFEKKMKAIELNKRRAAAVKVLIEDKMFDEAKMLLKLIDSKYSQGKKEVLSGYIFALQGECDKSSKMFDRALSINPNVCIPDEYKSDCAHEDKGC